MNTLLQTRQAYSEVDNFIDLLDEEDRNKIPSKLRNFFKSEKDINYSKKIDINLPIKEQHLLEETLALIALLNLKYICEDENEKENLTKIYQENEDKYQELLREKYNPDNIFKNRNVVQYSSEESKTEQTAIMEYKEKNFMQKLFDKIKHLFKRK